MNKIKIDKALIMKVLKIAFLVLVAFFLIRYFKRNIKEIRELDFKPNWGVFALSMLFYFVYKVTLASLWHYITYLNDSSIAYKDAVVGYLYSILGKYIPGKVFMLAARLPAYEKEGVNLGKVTICFFLENICTLLGAAFLFLVSLFFFPRTALMDLAHKIVPNASEETALYIFIGMLVLLIIAFFICINPAIINFFLRNFGKIIKKQDMEIPITYPQMIKVVLLFIANWIVVGAGFYLLVRSIYPVPLSEALYCAGIYGISAIIGILAIFTVSGLGVREGIIGVCLALIIPSEPTIVIISVISRLWATVAELILIAIAAIINNFVLKNKDNKKQKK
ncbi:MAG: flippase-like domain-containing protein [Lachnospiraceae bacterium]|nr:flippase-like domain-containing protein [Lachnospiraceae bacterium]